MASPGNSTVPTVSAHCRSVLRDGTEMLLKLLQTCVNWRRRLLLSPRPGAWRSDTVLQFHDEKNCVRTISGRSLSLVTHLSRCRSAYLSLSTSVQVCRSLDDFCCLTTRRWCKKGVKVAHSWLPSVGFRSWSRFLAVSLQVTWVINPAVGCRYFPPGPQLPSEPLRGLLPVSLLGEQRHDGCEQLA